MSKLPSIRSTWAFSPLVSEPPRTILQPEAQKAEALAEEIFQHVEGQEGLSDLFTSPMMLTAACILFHQEKRLPKDVYDLYNRLVNNILFNRIQAKNQLEKIRGRLMVIAHGMHTGKEGLEEQRTSPQAEVTYGEIERMLTTYRRESPETESGVTSIQQARESLLSDTGLLLSRGPEKAAFYHLSFQEFLAAQRILELEFSTDKLAVVFLERSQIPEWKATLNMLFASQGSRFSNRHSVDLLRILIPKTSRKEADLGLLQVIAGGLEVLQARQVLVASELRSQFDNNCIRVIESEAGPLDQRHQLALSLGRLGDPRVVGDLRCLEAFVQVPAGKYRVGEGKEQREIAIDAPFLLSRFPVTNSQFRLFIEDGGYKRPELWSETGRRWLGKATEPLFWKNGGPNQPVVGVCYWEAEAFARWAGGRLPSEWEWEVAARGKDACEFPWCGDWEDGICNSREAGLRMASAVGLFPRSRSPQGLDDLSGNVEEWCFLDEAEAKDADMEIDARRPVRGGSWVDPRDGRASVRPLQVRCWRSPRRPGFSGVVGCWPEAQQEQRRQSEQQPGFSGVAVCWPERSAGEADGESRRSSLSLSRPVQGPGGRAGVRVQTVVRRRLSVRRLGRTNHEWSRGGW